MTKDEILAMRPGMKLNLTIATRLLGWIIWEEKRNEFGYVVFQKPGEDEPYKRQQRWEAIKDRYKQIGIDEVDQMRQIVCGLKDWSTDISAALGIVEEFDFYYIDKSGYGEKAYKVRVDVCLANGAYTPVEGFGNTLPEAICKAALLAKEVTV